jgi:adenylosuccinate lyase
MREAQSGAHIIAAEMRSMSGSNLTAWLVPLSETKEGKKRLQEYYEALGRFTDMFSQVETAIALTLWYYAKLTKDIAIIIFAGARIEVSSSYIKQLAKVTGAKAELQHDLEYILQQLGIINGARNDIVHFGATSVAEGQWHCF